MTLLKKLFGEPEPQKVEALKPSAAELAVQELERTVIANAVRWFAGLKQQFDSLLQKRAADLRAHGLPVPQINGELTYECRGIFSLKVLFPAPCVPPHFIVHSRSRVPPPEWALFTPAVYVVTGTPAVVEAAAKVYEQRGIAALVKESKGVWLNQDPYELYEYLELQSNQPGNLTFTDIRDLGTRHLNLAIVRGISGAAIDAQTGQFRLPLQRLPDYTPEDLRQIERRFSFYTSLSDSKQQCLFETACSFPKKKFESLPPSDFHKFPNKVLFSDLPEPTFSNKIVALKILPSDATRPNIAKEFLDSLRSINHPIAFEIIDDGTTIYFQIVCEVSDRKHIQHQLELHFPSAAIIEQSAAPRTAKQYLTAQPQKMYAETRQLSDFPLDPLTQFFSALNKQTEGHTTALQILCFPVPNETITTITEALRERSTPDNIKAVARKIPAWQATLRAFSSNPQTLAQIRSSFFGPYATPQYVWTASQPKEGSFTQRDMAKWALLSTAELTALAHFPMAPIECDRLETVSMKAKLPPDLFTAGEVQIGFSEARGQRKPVVLPDSVRARHLYIVGKSGSGKSTLITNIAVQDIERGEGVCIIDPHGDLVSDLLDRIPERRVKDTIYFNVSDRTHPIGLDMISANNEAEIEILTDDLITTFRRLTETWGERMETILRYAFNTLLRTPDATFLDVQKLLTNEGWRATTVRKLNFPPLADFWFNQYVNMPKDAAQPILSRMTKIVLSPTLNAIFGQSTSRLNFNDVIRNRKILLVNLGGDSRDRNNAQLAVSDEMKKLIGSVVVSQLQLAAMRQASIPEAERVPCRFFVDEFQNFVSGAFPKILSEARKYKLCLTVAHQYISQLDDATRNAVFGNVGTMIVMPLGQKDAAYLGAELGTYTPEDVANLSPERHEALCRPSTQAADTFLFTTLAPRPLGQSFAQAVINHTRTAYSAQPDEEDLPAPEPGDAGDNPATKIPMREMPKDFASTAEKVLHYVSRANYLTNSQIIELCYSHLSEASKRPAASRDLKKLTESKKLKATNWGEGKVFYVGSQCYPTAHNIAIRDLLIKIWQSGYEIAEVNLAPTLGALSPDMLVSFLCEDGSILPTYWEYDAGTEGLTEILKKVARYVPYSAVSRVCFVCNTRERVQAIMKAAQAAFIEYCVLDELTKLDAPAFVSRTHNDKYSFF